MKGLIICFELCLFRRLHYYNNLLNFHCVRYTNLLILRLGFILENKDFHPIARDFTPTRKTGRFLPNSAVPPEKE
jgi:hypothetical protein